jgi:hypothetical protein
VDPVPVSWGHPDPVVRAPVICTVRHSSQRNAIGAHQGSYCIYTGLAVAAGKLDPNYVPDLRLTSPVFKIGPYPSWSDPKKIAGNYIPILDNNLFSCTFIYLYIFDRLNTHSRSLFCLSSNSIGSVWSHGNRGIWRLAR